MNTEKIINDTKNMIDDLKSVCANKGLGNASSEYKIITEVFLYKFLNDKFMYEVRQARESLRNSKNLEEDLANMSDDEYEKLLASIPPTTALLKREHYISYLFNRKYTEKFNELFDNTLVDLANYNIDIFSVKTGGEDRIKLFDPISVFVIQADKRSEFCRALIDKIVEFSFENAFSQKYDFFATIFEYLIKDYNKDFGKYAEYYTPHSIASIIARIMVPDGAENVTVYDPAAGSGTLVLALAHEIGEENCTIYTQDISQKSNEFLRLNLVLNNLVHSLGNVVHGDTLLYPAHRDRQGKNVMKFDYIVSNPPFNVDFSESRDTLAGENYKSRFWAGVPNIPKKDKKSMQIYLLFVQHIICSLKDGGKAAIVVPTPFITKEKGIEKKIRNKLIDDYLLKAVITMPSNIFSTTGTNVSVLYLKNDHNPNTKVQFIEASLLGSKSTETERNQKTILSKEEQDLIVSTYKNGTVKNGFSTFATYDQIKKCEYRLSPSTYFEHEMKYEKYSKVELPVEISKRIDSLKLYYSNELEEIISILFNNWFVDFEFPVEGGTYKSSDGKFDFSPELGMKIPKGWKVLPINDKNVCKIVDCLHSKKPNEKYESESYYLLQSENLTQDGKISLKNKYYISKQDYEFWSAKIEIQPLDFIVTNAGRAGAIGMVPDGVHCAIGRNMTAIRAVGISPYYIRQFLLSPYMQKFLAANLDEGSFFKSFNVKAIKKIKVLIPSDDILEKYTQIVQPLIDMLLNGVIAQDEISKVKTALKEALPNEKQMNEE